MISSKLFSKAVKFLASFIAILGISSAVHSTYACFFWGFDEPKMPESMIKKQIKNH